MKKMITIATAIAMMAFGYMGHTAFGANMDKMDKSNYGTSSQNQNMSRTDAKAHDTWMQSHELSYLKGKNIKDTKGDKIGSIKDFVIDDQGRIQFAVVSAKGKDVAVPFEALQASADGKSFTLNTTKDQLANAPEFNKKTVVDHSYTESVYKFFGLQPRWSDQGMTGSTSEQGMTGSTSQGTTGSEGTMSGSSSQSYGTSSQGSQDHSQESNQPRSNY